MSDWYFIDRQDRYILFEKEAELTEHFCKISDTISNISIRYISKNKLKNPILYVKF
jgi:hypothetical protein